MIRGKRGIIKTEFPKILLAVICILILVALAFRLYYVFKGDKEMEKAKANLVNLDAQLKLNKDTTMILEQNPHGVWGKEWYLSSWQQLKENPTGLQEGVETDVGLITETTNGIPLACSSKNWQSCICICNGKTKEDCDKRGTCIQAEKETQIIGGYIDLETMKNIKIENQEKIIITQIQD